MVAWSVLLLELTTLERAFCASGGATVACGIWLVLWVLLLLKPSVPTHELWDFAMADLAQMQHLAMGVLFVASGSAELYFAHICPAMTCGRLAVAAHHLGRVHGVDRRGLCRASTTQ